MMRGLPIFALLVAFSCASTRATDYYVDLGAGHDANPGTLAAPWRTLTYAMSVVPIAQGHRVLVRGSANTASPGESFPIRVGAGISLGTWDAQQGAVLDAGGAICLQLVGPAHRVQSVRGIAGNLLLRGSPAIAVPVLADYESVELQVEDCRLVGGFLFDLAELPPGVQRWGRCVTALRRCEVQGDVSFWLRTSFISNSRNVMSASLEDNTIDGDVLLRRVASPSVPIVIRGNRIDGAFLLDGGFASSISVQDNAVTNGSMNLGAFGRMLGNPLVVHDNQVSGDLLVNGSGPLTVLRNRVGGALDAYDYETTAVNDNVVGGRLSLSSNQNTPIPCEALRNVAGSMLVSSLGVEPLVIAENTLRSTLQVDRLPHAAVQIRSNRITCGAGEHGIALFAFPHSWPAGTTLLDLSQNELRASTPGGAGVFVSYLQASRFVCASNRIEGFDRGLAIEQTAVLQGTPSGQEFRIERNHLRGNATGIALDLSGSQEDLRLMANVVEGGQRGLALQRGGYLGTIRMWNNILAFHASADVAAAFSPLDRVQWNLAADGSLLARDLTNLAGDPHFVDRASGDVRLLPSSPAVGSGVDLVTASPGFNLGLDPLAPARTLRFEAQGSTGALHFAATGASVALVVFGLAPAQPASISLCDGRLGVDPATWVATVPLALQGGAGSLPLTLPAGPWSVAVQALSDASAAPFPCRASNTVLARR